MSDGWFVKGTGIKLADDLLLDVLRETPFGNVNTAVETVIADEELQIQTVKKNEIEFVADSNILDPYYDIPIFDFDDIDMDSDNHDNNNNYHTNNAADNNNNDDNIIHSNNDYHNNCNKNDNNSDNNNNNNNNNNNSSNNEAYHKFKSEQCSINLELRQNTAFNSSLHMSDHSWKNQLTNKIGLNSALQLNNDKCKKISPSPPAIYLISQSAGFSVKNKFVTQGQLNDLLSTYQTNNQ